MTPRTPERDRAGNPRTARATCSRRPCPAEGETSPLESDRSLQDTGRVSLIGRKLSRRFRLEQIVLVPGAERPPDAVTQRAALVVVERGEIELELTNRVCQRFASGAVLYTAGLPLRVIRNVAPDTVLMSFLSRRADEESA